MVKRDPGRERRRRRLSARRENTGRAASGLATRPARGRRQPGDGGEGEGHEGEDEERSRELLGELTQATGSDLAALTVYRDGDSAPRVIALVLRRGMHAVR